MQHLVPRDGIGRLVELMIPAPPGAGHDGHDRLHGRAPGLVTPQFGHEHDRLVVQPARRPHQRFTSASAAGVDRGASSSRSIISAGAPARRRSRGPAGCCPRRCDLLSRPEREVRNVDHSRHFAIGRPERLSQPFQRQRRHGGRLRRHRISTPATRIPYGLSVAATSRVIATGRAVPPPRRFACRTADRRSSSGVTESVHHDWRIQPHERFLTADYHPSALDGAIRHQIRAPAGTASDDWAPVR